MRLKPFPAFACKVIVAHVVTYFIVGAIAYQLFTKQFYEGSDPIFSTFMRTPAGGEVWRHVMTWFVPGQIARGLLIVVALYPFFDAVKSWPRNEVAKPFESGGTEVSRSRSNLARTECPRPTMLERPP